MDPNAAAKAQMNPLSQEEFEEILKSSKPHPLQVIYFTAKWCGPCKNLKLQSILDSFKGIKWHVCDVDDNEYTPGYCGLKSIPSFLAIVKGKPVLPMYQQSDANKVIEWIDSIVKKI
jgi:thioredoxin-like negative regulator of GroEL